MDARTSAHLRRAERNRDIAREIIESSWSVQPAPYEWAVVAGFYAAVHDVNAYLWEKHQYEPRDHDDRQRAVARHADLKPVLGAYTRLRDLAFQARYMATSRVTESAARAAVSSDLADIERAVMSALRAAPAGSPLTDKLHPSQMINRGRVTPY